MLAKIGVALVASVLLTVPAAAQQVSPPGESPSQPSAGPQQPPPDAVAFDVKRGDEWKYELRDFLTHEIKATITYVAADALLKEIDVRVTYLNSKNGKESSFLMLFNRNWQLLESPQLLVKDRDEPDFVLGHPTIGKTWTYSYTTVQKTTGSTRKWYGRAKIADWEKIVLRSGRSFDAFKIERHESDGQLADRDVTSGTSSIANRTDILNVSWFAPAVNRTVRELSQTRINGRLFDGSEQELLEYERHPD